MSHEAVPEPNTPQPGGSSEEPEEDGLSKGLLDQMDELMAALNADLTRLDADLQSRLPDEDEPQEQDESPELPGQDASGAGEAESSGAETGSGPA
ncbi:hypothetical protein [Streptomyces sp. ODS28]|uniref:hypothetical protein n=1 Tax=Streptomyces sp. ODS28 TaxID=3136688 RepID=UPI0031EF24D1